MFLQPISFFLSLMALSGSLLAAVQIAMFSTTPPPSALTASIKPAVTELTSERAKGRQIVNRSADGLFYIDGTIDGISVKFAVDTGASVVVLNANDAERVGLDPTRSENQRIRTASGYSSMIWAQADDFTVAGRNLGNMEVAIMPDGPAISLLGLNALSRMETITIKKNQLIIE